MDRLRSGGCGAAVSKGGRLSRDTDVHRLDAERVGQEADCQRSCGRLVYECRGSLTFNGTPGNLAVGGPITFGFTCAAPSQAQSQDAATSASAFEVASVKPNK